MVRSAAAELIAAQDEAITCYTAESASEMLEPEQRCASSKKLAYQRNLRGAFSRVSEWPENCILVATQPLQSFLCLDAFGVTAQLTQAVRSTVDTHSPSRLLRTLEQGDNHLVSARGIKFAAADGMIHAEATDGTIAHPNPITYNGCRPAGQIGQERVHIAELGQRRDPGCL